MRILKRILTKNGYEKEVFDIETISDFLFYYNSIINSTDKFIKMPEHVNEFILDKINNNKDVTYKSTNRIVSKMINSPKFKTKIEYWTIRGYSIEEAKIKVSKLQTINANLFAKKRLENPEEYIGIIPNQSEYWTKLGFSETEAKLKVKERQTTFTLDKCIKKLGVDEGTKRFNDRQIQWQALRIKSEGKDWSYTDQSLSFEKYIKRYGDDWLIYKINHIKKNKRSENILRINVYSKINQICYVEKQNLLDYLLELNFDELCEIINNANSVIEFILKLNHVEIKSKWCAHNNIKKIVTKKWGTRYYSNGNYYQSTGEFEIGSFLEKNNIEFEIHKRYEGTYRFSDFYIPFLDLYVEFMGMKDDAYIDKKKQLNKTLYNIIWFNSPDKIKKHINEKIYEYNRCQ
jgi:hypothetical protein